MASESNGTAPHTCTAQCPSFPYLFSRFYMAETRGRHRAREVATSTRTRVIRINDSSALFLLCCLPPPQHTSNHGRSRGLAAAKIASTIYDPRVPVRKCLTFTNATAGSLLPCLASKVSLLLRTPYSITIFNPGSGRLRQNNRFNKTVNFHEP